MPETQTSVEELQQQAQEATREARMLAQRRFSIEREIEDERQAISQARIQAARRGESIIEAAERSQLDALLEERDELPERLWAARLRVPEAEIRLQQQRAEQAAAELPEARQEVEEVAGEYDEIRQRLEAARRRAGTPEAHRFAAVKASREAEKALQQIEAEGAKLLY